jgi:hypothetical protein
VRTFLGWIAVFVFVLLAFAVKDGYEEVETFCARVGAVVLVLLVPTTILLFVFREKDKPKSKEIQAVTEVQSIEEMLREEREGLLLRIHHALADLSTPDMQLLELATEARCSDEEYFSQHPVKSLESWQARSYEYFIMEHLLKNYSNQFKPTL